METNDIIGQIVDQIVNQIVDVIQATDPNQILNDNMINDDNLIQDNNLADNNQIINLSQADLINVQNELSELSKLEKELEEIMITKKQDVIKLNSNNNIKIRHENQNQLRQKLENLNGEQRKYQRNEQRYVRPERPMIRNNVTGEFDIKFASASITFVHGKTGQLHCSEYRWPERYEDGKNVYHLVGGKVEKEDIDILFTAIREFVEETNIFMDQDLIKNNSISILSKYMYTQIKSRTKYYDIKVSERNNLYHRCFMFNVNKFTNIEYRNKILGLPVFYKKLLNSDTRINKELNDLKWMSVDELKNINDSDTSSLLKTYVENLNNFV